MPPRAAKIQQASQSRVWLIEDGAGPANSPDYMEFARAGAITWDQGGSTPIRVPSRTAYGQFDIVDRQKGQAALPQLSVEVRRQRTLSEMLRLSKSGCPVDIQVHIGACKNPSDFNEGWEIITILEDALIDSYGTTELGAFDADQDVPIVETVPFTGLDLYEVKPIAGAEVAAAEIVQEIISIAICDSKTCGECGLTPSDGCQRIFALTLSAGGSPGLPAEIIYSQDGGLTWADTNVSTLAANEDPNALTCVGTNLVVISEDSESLHYASIADILDAAEAWAEVTSGFVATKGPLGIFSIDRTHTWIAAEGGYIYFSDDITSAVTVQSAGSVSVQDLRSIHGINEMSLVAVGASNAVLATSNGGETWSSITGPDVGVNLNVVRMKSETEWFVGTAGGKLYYTRNGGASWVEKTFSGSGSGQVRDIAFSSRSVGYMSHDTATPHGRIFRTIDGGYSWYPLPEGLVGALPTSDRITALAICEEDKNLVYGGGLADNGTDGILIKVA